MSRAVRSPFRGRKLYTWSTAAAIAALVGAAGCGGSSTPSSSSSSPAAGAQKGGTLTILANAGFGVADPAQNYTLQQWSLLINTHDGLAQFQRVAGPAGTRLVPDLATSLPQPTNGGKTYVFHIRKGIKFSNGQTMKPSDFVATFERQFTVPGPTSFYSRIVGADKCSTKGCDLSQGAVADDSAYTLTINLTAPDPEFLDKLALPFAYVVPASTSKKLTGNNVPPGTGPYMWQSYNPNTQAVLVRNPYFHVWSSAAQPAGYPDKIVEKYGQTVSDEVTAVQNGQADAVYDGDVIPADRLNELNSPKYASQVHVNPLTADWYFALNTRRPPFNNLKARQAINYAADRSAYVKIAGGPSLAVPTCQILPPNFPGYKPYCPYTAGTDHTKWTGPDLAKARQLVKESGTAGMKVVVNSDNESNKAIAEQMAADLNKIGYKASTQLLNASIQYPFVQNSDNSGKWNVAYSAWYQDYPAASDFLNVLTGCGSIHPHNDASPNIAAFCDKTIQAQMDKALTLGVTDPAAANAMWAQVDHAVTDQAPWVDLYNPKLIDFLSSRVHGYQFNPQWYILLDQLWLK
ncbi:MAG TPA: ABC transporter substrate-binding protein [Streptosporangiaceae bacterium]|nr:ABC transporter substrate-binding protein [Streptosporangiaceae bacterium]